MLHLQKDDPAMAALLEQEQERIEHTLNLIAAENHAPCSIIEALRRKFPVYADNKVGQLDIVRIGNIY